MIMLGGRGEGGGEGGGQGGSSEDSEDAYSAPAENTSHPSSTPPDGDIPF